MPARIDEDDSNTGSRTVEAAPLRPRKAIIARIILVGLCAVTLILARPLQSHAVAAGVLLRLSDTGDTMGLRDWRTVPIVRKSLTLELAGKSVPAYRYEPEIGAGPIGMVLVHGVHFRGIDEPRLVRFAESIAKTGVTVLTPRIASLADYRIDRDAIVQIGGAAHALRQQLGADRPVGVLGISFSGSLALLAAADETLGADIAYVVTVGSYDDLGRVSRFYATGSIERPDGTTVTLRPHEYGPVVWIYSHLADFFPAEGLEDVRASLRHWLHEERDDARAGAARLPEASKKKLEAIFAGDIATAAPDLADDVGLHAAELDALSPHGHLEQIRVAVFALHGSDDHLIPPSETLWLAHDLPPGVLAYALISGALTHVELGEQASFAERFQAVHFMAGVLAAARHAGT